MKLPQEFDKEITKLVHNFPVELNEFLKKFLIQNKDLFSFNTFQIELIVDTNILFSEVRSLMLNDSSFLMTLCKNPFIKLFAPSQIKRELHDKIKLKFPKEKKTRDLDINECICTANKVLDKVEISDNIDIFSKIRAEKIIKERDADDVCFLALSFSLKSHGIISRDKDLIEQGEVKVWNLADAGQMITEINKGAFSFLILGETVPFIWKIIQSLLLYIWRLLINSVKQLAMFGFNTLKNGTNYLAKIPMWLWIVLGISALAISQSEKTKRNINEFFSDIWEELKPILGHIKSLFKSLVDIFKEMYLALAPILGLSFDLLAYQRLEELDKQNKC